MQSDGIPGMGVIFVVLALAFLEWVAWSPWALAVTFGTLVATFGLILYLNLSSARDARRIASHLERQEQANHQQKGGPPMT